MLQEVANELYNDSILSVFTIQLVASNSVATYILSENTQKRDKKYPVSCMYRFYSLPLRTFSIVDYWI